VLPTDFRGSVDLQLPEVFQSLWDMGITFGMDRLVSADSNCNTEQRGGPRLPCASLPARNEAHKEQGLGQVQAQGQRQGPGQGQGEAAGGSFGAFKVMAKQRTKAAARPTTSPSHAASLPQLLPRFGLEDPESLGRQDSGVTIQSDTGPGRPAGGRRLEEHWDPTCTRGSRQGAAGEVALPGPCHTMLPQGHPSACAWLQP